GSGPVNMAYYGRGVSLFASELATWGAGYSMDASVGEFVHQFVDKFVAMATFDGPPARMQQRRPSPAVVGGMLSGAPAPPFGSQLLVESVTDLSNGTPEFIDVSGRALAIAEARVTGMWSALATPELEAASELLSQH